MLRALEAEDSDDDRYDTARGVSSILAKPEGIMDDNSKSISKHPKGSMEAENDGTSVSLDGRPEELQSIDSALKGTVSDNNKYSNGSSESFIKSVKISMCADLISKTALDKYTVNKENLEIFFQAENIINQNDFKPEMLDNKEIYYFW